MSTRATGAEADSWTSGLPRRGMWSGCASRCCCRPRDSITWFRPCASSTHKVDSFPDLTLDEARVRIRELPCCTAKADGTGEGDPLNIVIVGDGEDVLAAMTAGGWDFTEAITVDSVRRMVGAAIADSEMLQAPVSALYAFGRKQDIALQRGRLHIAQRNHIRLLARTVPVRRAAGLGRTGEPRHRREGHQQVADAHDPHHRPERRRVAPVRAAEPSAPGGGASGLRSCAASARRPATSPGRT